MGQDQGTVQNRLERIVGMSAEVILSSSKVIAGIVWPPYENGWICNVEKGSERQKVLEDLGAKVGPCKRAGMVGMFSTEEFSRNLSTIRKQTEMK